MFRHLINKCKSMMTNAGRISMDSVTRCPKLALLKKPWERKQPSLASGLQGPTVYVPPPAQTVFVQA